ncbi:hypothetical protein V502_01224 [Pseudogymnoascus sp. VKM F-4520 (FW-2644)]|nr:hypothetical protein V502_01224 [Pseudogymnoascus sp. VKM F-4520 (FW-2644)]
MELDFCNYNTTGSSKLRCRWVQKGIDANDEEDRCGLFADFDFENVILNYCGVINVLIGKGVVEFAQRRFNVGYGASKGDASEREKTGLED